MPVIKSAQKKLRQDKKREKKNDVLRHALQKIVKMARKNPAEKTIQDATRALDKAVKKNILHKNKAARLKSAMSKLLSGKTTVNSAPKKPTKKKKPVIKKSTKK